MNIPVCYFFFRLARYHVRCAHICSGIVVDVIFQQFEYDIHARHIQVYQTPCPRDGADDRGSGVHCYPRADQYRLATDLRTGPGNDVLGLHTKHILSYHATNCDDLPGRVVLETCHGTGSFISH